MKISFKEQTFSGEDPVMIFDFFTLFVEEADNLRTTEAQEFLLLLTFPVIPHIEKFMRAGLPHN